MIKLKLILPTTYKSLIYPSWIINSWTRFHAPSPLVITPYICAIQSTPESAVNVSRHNVQLTADVASARGGVLRRFSDFSIRSTTSKRSPILLATTNTDPKGTPTGSHPTFSVGRKPARGWSAAEGFPEVPTMVVETTRTETIACSTHNDSTG